MKKFLLMCLVLLVGCGEEAALTEYSVTIFQHQFVPNLIEVTQNKRVRLVITNKDDSAEEFESFDLKKEHLIPAHTTSKINIGPLKPGEYKFFGEFHEKTAQGIIKVK